MTEQSPETYVTPDVGAVHGVHAPCELRLWNRPPAHGKHAVFGPTGAYLPSGQAVQVITLLVPSDVNTFALAEYCPAGHGAQESGVVETSQYKPALQPSAQALQLGMPVWPAVSVPPGHAAHVVAPAADDVSTTHSIQTTDSVADWYLPAGQSVHAAPVPNKYCPAAQAVQRVAASFDVAL